MLRRLLILALVALYALHNDWWWESTRPRFIHWVLLAGWPVQLLYYVAYCVMVSLVLWLLVRSSAGGDAESVPAVDREAASASGADR